MTRDVYAVDVYSADGLGLHPYSAWFATLRAAVRNAAGIVPDAGSNSG